jgi:prevent-host-death family protein
MEDAPMDLAKSIEPVTVFKTRSAALIRKARQSGQPVVITRNGKPAAVLQDVETYQRQREALMLLKYLSRGREEARRGKSVSHEKAMTHARRTLERLKREKALSR